MPVKNAVPYLAACLDSIIAQSEKDWELLAVNDHSTDETPSILAAYANKDARIKILENEGQGIIPALRTAYKHSTRPLLSRMDADDLMPVDKLATLKALLLENGKGHLATGKVRYFSEAVLGNGFTRYQNWLNSLIDENNHFTEIYRECVIPSPCWMVWREDFERCGSFDSDLYPEDYDLCFRFYKQGLKVVSSPSVLHKWRDYPVRTSRTHEHYSDNRFLEIKLHYFLELDWQNGRTVAIWGAGKKGKWLAKELVARSVPVRWFSNNPNKTGQQIYGITLEAETDLPLNQNLQVIVAIAMPDTQARIRDLLVKGGLSAGKDFYFFC